MKKLSMQISAVFSLVLLSACGAPDVPGQSSIDQCSEKIGLNTKLTLVTSPTGGMIVEMSPPGSLLSTQEAAALQSCIKNL